MSRSVVEGSVGVTALRFSWSVRDAWRPFFRESVVYGLGQNGRDAELSGLHCKDDTDLHVRAILSPHVEQIRRDIRAVCIAVVGNLNQLRGSLKH